VSLSEDMVLGLVASNGWILDESIFSSVYFEQSSNKKKSKKMVKKDISDCCFFLRSAHGQKRHAIGTFSISGLYARFGYI